MLDNLLAIDAALLTWLASHSYPHWLDTLMAFITTAGTRSAIWLALGLFAVSRCRSYLPGVWRMGLALGLTTFIVVAILKPVIARDRPFTTNGETRAIGEYPSNYSFPSGHAASAAAGAFALTRIWPNAHAALWALAGLISASRLYLGVHYPLDIVAGLLVGLSCSYFVTGGLTYRGPVQIQCTDRD